MVVDFQNKKEKTVFVVRDKSHYFSEALGFSPPSLLVNTALPTVVVSFLVVGLKLNQKLLVCRWKSHNSNDIQCSVTEW